VPVNPEIAAARLTEPFEERIRSYRSSADMTRERLLQLMPAYLSRSVRASAAVNSALEEVPDGRDVQLLINKAVETCTKDMMTVTPGGKRDPAQLQDVLPRDMGAAKRGVRVRLLYQHTTRTVLSARTYISAMVEAGGEVRTVDQLPERMLIFDREMAFIPKRSRPDARPGALIVRDPVVVSFLCALFDQFWVGAVPFIPEGPGYQDVSDDMQRSIVQLLAQGLKDEAVAKRLGMSVRTCRRHIASLMQELGAESRFEAGVKASQLGLIRRDTSS
jgi:DNA-binding CsgD family transcriptional regulator/sugar-specific transcriptional regulator TrmB